MTLFWGFVQPEHTEPQDRCCGKTLHAAGLAGNSGPHQLHNFFQPLMKCAVGKGLSWGVAEGSLRVLEQFLCWQTLLLKHARGWTSWPPEVPSNLNYAMSLYCSCNLPSQKHWVFLLLILVRPDDYSTLPSVRGSKQRLEVVFQPYIVNTLWIFNQNGLLSSICYMLLKVMLTYSILTT